MNRIKLFTACLTGLLLFTSCQKFLELHPRDKKVVSTIEDYRDIMASYMSLLKVPNRSQDPVFGIYFNYPYFDMTKYLGIYTGETILNKRSPFYYDQAKSAYTSDGMKLMTWMDTEPYCWNQYYQFLGSLNLVISGIRTATGKDEDLRNYVLGEALVWRAFGYFKLLQYFSPYKNKEWGIPVFLQSAADLSSAMPPRNTQPEVFAQILGDCQEAAELMKKTPSNDWNCAWREDFIHAMLAGIYSWKAMSGAAEDSDWENAEKNATAAMKGRSLTNSPAILKQMFDCRDVTPSTQMINDEFYFRILDGSNGQIFDFITAYYEGDLIEKGVSLTYYKMFKDNDIRKSVYFTPDGTQSDKYNLLGLGPSITTPISFMKGGCLMLFRLAEMYLIKAEALVRQGKAGEARAVLQEFKTARYTGGNPSLPGDPDQLLQEILDERTREFYIENDFRWLDMKRLGIKLERQINGEKFILAPDDFRYSFPTPAKEIEQNKNIHQTPGWENVILD